MVALQGQALPFGQGVHHLAVDAHIGDVKGHRALYAVEVIVEAGAAVHEGSLGAYCADVMAQEPPSKENPLFGEPNAYLTPHIAWATYEARERLNKQVAANVKAFLEGNPINVVNK